MTTDSNSTMGQLKEKLLAASQEEIAKVVKEAQDEALLEAKSHFERAHAGSHSQGCYW